MAETWVINENITGSTLPDTTINFTSNESSFSRIRYYKPPGDPSIIFYGDMGVWTSGTWNSQAYRTVTFETAPTGDLLTWLQANAVKQGPEQVSIDLTTLSGWSGLSDGSHSITVKAKATGYRDSEASQAVSVTKAPSTYSGTITTHLSSLSMGKRDVAIKFDAPPTSDDDYDAWVSNRGAFSGSTTYSNRSKLYAWFTGRESGQIQIGNGEIVGNFEYGYDHATEIALTENANITLYYLNID